MATISAWAVGSSVPRIALRASAMISPSQRDHRADRHFARLGGDRGEVERAAHRRRQAGKRGHRRRASAERRDCHGSRHWEALVGAAWFACGRLNFDRGHL